MTPLRHRIARIADRLPAPRDAAARALLRAARDLVEGRQPAVDSVVAPENAPAVDPVVAPQSGPTPATPPVPSPVAVPPAGVHVWARPGSYSSPIVDPAEIVGDGSDAAEPVDLVGIHIDHEHHARVWAAWAPGVSDWLASNGTSRRYHANNRMFGEGSASLLAGALRAIRPRRYVEIGSGFSSAVALDVNDEQRPDDPMLCTFVEPYPDRLDEVLRPADRERCSVIRAKVQLTDLEVFDQIEAGDVLFIDSSHVGKSGSDLLRELFEILPRLPVGAFIHFHDILYPFDYPRAWLVEQNRSWNEAYFLRAFLMYNDCFRIHFWTDYWGLFGRDDARQAGTDDVLPMRSSSLWLVRAE